MSDESQYEYQQYLLKLQESNVLDGVTNEPRLYFDTIQLGLPLVEVTGHPDVFRNGEDFPVRITHVLMALDRLASDPQQSPVPPNLIQRVGVRLKFHDQYYMAPYSAAPFLQGVAPGIARQVFVTAPAWSLNSVSAADIVSDGASAWQFMRPFVLSVRDTLRVDVKLDAAAEGAVPVTVSFTGIGMLSRKPFFFSGSILLHDAIRATISTENYQNDGTEPVLITNMTVNCAGDLISADPTGDISRVSVGVRQIGNGTNASWMRGPINDPPIVPDLVPATLLGQQSGRAIVHRLPGNGLLWAPGEGIVAQVQNLDIVDVLFVSAKINIGLLGYISVQ
jgi:hypothetical protein